MSCRRRSLVVTQGERAPRSGRLSLVAAAVWFGLSYGGAVLGYLAVNAFAARLLQDEFGYFVLAVTASTVLGQLGLFGAHRGGLRAAARLDSGDDESLVDLRRAVRAVSTVTLPITAVLSALAAFFVVGEDQGAGRWVTAAGVAVLVWFGGQQKLLANYLRGFGRIRFASLLEGRSGGALVALCQGIMVGGLLLFFPDLGLPAAMVAMAVGFVVPVFFAWYVVFRGWRHVDPGRPTLKGAGQVIKRNRHFASNMLGGSLNSNLEIWIAGLLLTGMDASLFSAAQRLSLALSISIMSMGVVFSPVVSRLFDRDNVRLERLLRTGATVAAGLTAALWIPMLIAPTPLLRAVYGDSFTAAAPLLVILTLGGVSNVLTGMCAVTLTMSRHEAIVANVQWAAVLARVCLGVLLALQWGTTGLAISAAAVSAGLSVTFWYLTHRRMKMWTHLTLRPDIKLMRQTPG